MYFSNSGFFFRETLLMTLAANLFPVESSTKYTSPNDPAPIDLMGLYLWCIRSLDISSNFIFEFIMKISINIIRGYIVNKIYNNGWAI